MRDYNTYSYSTYCINIYKIPINIIQILLKILFMWNLFWVCHPCSIPRKQTDDFHYIFLLIDLISGWNLTIFNVENKIMGLISYYEWVNRTKFLLIVIVQWIHAVNFINRATLPVCYTQRNLFWILIIQTKFGF